MNLDVTWENIIFPSVLSLSLSVKFETTFFKVIFLVICSLIENEHC